MPQVTTAGNTPTTTSAILTTSSSKKLDASRQGSEIIPQSHRSGLSALLTVSFVAALEECLASCSINRFNRYARSRAFKARTHVLSS